MITFRPLQSKCFDPCDKKWSRACLLFSGVAIGFCKVFVVILVLGEW